jgi:Ala-tRNA(Pro) deacylase
MKIPARLINFLEAQGVAYEVRHHPIAYTAQELAAIEGVKGREHAKVVVVKLAGQLALAVLPSDCRVDLARLGAAALATEAEFREVFPDCATGTMPPFGHLWGVATYVDRRLAENARIVFEAGTHSDAISMSYADYARLARPVMGDFAVK